MLRAVTCSVGSRVRRHTSHPHHTRRCSNPVFFEQDANFLQHSPSNDGHAPSASAPATPPSSFHSPPVPLERTPCPTSLPRSSSSPSPGPASTPSLYPSMSPSPSLPSPRTHPTPTSCTGPSPLSTSSSPLPPPSPSSYPPKSPSTHRTSLLRGFGFGGTPPKWKAAQKPLSLLGAVSTPVLLQLNSRMKETDPLTHDQGAPHTTTRFFRQAKAPVPACATEGPHAQQHSSRRSEDSTLTQAAEVHSPTGGEGNKREEGEDVLVCVCTMPKGTGGSDFNWCVIPQTCVPPGKWSGQPAVHQSDPDPSSSSFAPAPALGQCMELLDLGVKKSLCDEAYQVKLLGAFFYSHTCPSPVGKEESQRRCVMVGVRANDWASAALDGIEDAHALARDGVEGIECAVRQRFALRWSDSCGTGNGCQVAVSHCGNTWAEPLLEASRKQWAEGKGAPDPSRSIIRKAEKKLQQRKSIDMGAESRQPMLRGKMQLSRVFRHRATRNETNLSGCEGTPGEDPFAAGPDTFTSSLSSSSWKERCPPAHLQRPASLQERSITFSSSQDAKKKSHAPQNLATGHPASLCSPTAQKDPHHTDTHSDVSFCPWATITTTSVVTAVAGGREGFYRPTPLPASAGFAPNESPEKESNAHAAPDRPTASLSAAGRATLAEDTPAVASVSTLCSKLSSSGCSATCTLPRGLAVSLDSQKSHVNCTAAASVSEISPHEPAAGIRWEDAGSEAGFSCMFEGEEAVEDSWLELDRMGKQVERTHDAPWSEGKNFTEGREVTIR